MRSKVTAFPVAALLLATSCSTEASTGDSSAASPASLVAPSDGTATATSSSMTQPAESPPPSAPVSSATDDTAMAPVSTAAPTTLADNPECLEALPLTWRIGQVLMPAVYGDDLGRAGQIVAELDIGNAILMSWPSGTDRNRLQAFKTMTGVPLLIATDEEGGDVQRLRSLGEFPSERAVAESMSPDAARSMIAAHAAHVAALGIDIVFAPVVDVSPTSGSDPIGDRAFSSDPGVVAEYAAAYADGWRSAGILPVAKHFPGHGSASADTHDGSATTPPYEVLQASDLVPYHALAAAGPVGVMVGHLDVPGLTDAEGVPASLSHAAIAGALRSIPGLEDALVVTDALDMRAISGSLGTPDAAVKAIAAGADIALYASLDESRSIIDAFAGAVSDGTLPVERLDESVRRILTLKDIDPCSVQP